MVFNPFFKILYKCLRRAQMLLNIAQDVPVNPPETANIFRENTLDTPNLHLCFAIQRTLENQSFLPCDYVLDREVCLTSAIHHCETGAHLSCPERSNYRFEDSFLLKVPDFSLSHSQAVLSQTR